MQRLPLRSLSTTGATAGQVPVYDPAIDSYAPGDAAGDGFNPDAGRPPRLVPYGVKLRGVNLVPQDSVGNPWASLYANWATKWPTIVKPQIDKAASVGTNAARLIGDIDCVRSGSMTIDAYVAAYEQFVDYCDNLGLWVYACLASSQHWNGATKDQALAIMRPVAAMLETKPKVIGIDVVQEVGVTPALWSGSTEHDFLAYLFASLRQVTSLPLTCSTLGGDPSNASQWSTSTTAAFADLVDFYDFHPYYDGMVAADLNPFFTATGKPLVIGEYGLGTGDTRYAAAAAVSELSGVVGSFVWATVDNQLGEGNGLFDFNLVERPSRTAIFRTVPDHQGTLPEAGHVIQDEGVTLPARGRLNFVGAGATATDDAANDATTVNIPGSSGSTSTGVGELLMQDGVTGPPVPLENEARSDWLYQG